MSEQIIKDRGVEALKTAAGWPGADRVTLVTLASVLAATGADAEGSSYFEALSARQPDQPLPLALAGYFGVRVGQDIPAALAKLDDAAARDLGPAQYYRGLALAGLPPESGHAAQAVADLEFVLVVRDQFPTPLLRAVYHGLAAVYAALGKDDLAAQAAANSGLATAPPGARFEFGGLWVNAADGLHFGAPRLIEPAPGIRVAQGYDLGDFAFLSTGDGVVAIDAGTAPHRVRAAMSDAGVQDSQVSHVILTHSHFDHAGMLEALRFIIDLGPRTLIHGHILLTEVFTMETVTGLLPALSELREQALAGLGADLTLTALLDSNILPDVLRENPAAVGPLPGHP